MGKLRLRASYRRAAVTTGAVAVASAGFLLIAGPASAHSAPITGTAACASNGTYTVTYQVHVSTVHDLQVGWTFYLYSTAPTGSTVEPFNGTGFADSSLTLTQVNVPATTTYARIIGEVKWTDGYTSGDQTGTVVLNGACPSGTVTPPTVSPTTSAPTSVGTTSTAPTSVSTTSTAPTSVGTTSTAPTSASTTSTAATTAPAGSTSSAVAPPPPSSTSAATTAPVSSFNNAPPPPTTHAVEATSATNATTSAVAIDVPSASPSATTVSSPALASTGPELPVGRTIGWAGLLASAGGLLLVLTRRRQHN